MDINEGKAWSELGVDNLRAVIEDRSSSECRLRIAALVISASVISAPAFATDECFETAKLYGAMMRASLICNFPERPALSKAIAALPEACPAPSEAEFKEIIRPGVEEGFRVFENDRIRDGDDKACADWDKFMGVLRKN